MAGLIREQDTLVLRLSRLEKWVGSTSDISVPVSSVKSITILDEAVYAVHGLGMTGRYFPGVFAMGTFVSKEGIVFSIVHHQTKRGLKINLHNATYDALIVGVDDPEKLAFSLGLGINIDRKVGPQ